MKAIRLVAMAALGMAATAPASAQQFLSAEEVGRVISETESAIFEMANTYAASVDLGPDYVHYCQTKLRIATSGLPLDGTVPYGIDFAKISSLGDLSYILGIREQYEVIYLTLCVAKARKILDDAKPR